MPPNPHHKPNLDRTSERPVTSELSTLVEDIVMDIPWRWDSKTGLTVKTGYVPAGYFKLRSPSDHFEAPGVYLEQTMIEPNHFEYKVRIVNQPHGSSQRITTFSWEGDSPDPKRDEAKMNQANLIRLLRECQKGVGLNELQFIGATRRGPGRD